MRAMRPSSPSSTTAKPIVFAATAKSCDAALGLLANIATPPIERMMER
jgi:hypothetical protein